jgi:hypothetical protein
MTVLRFKTYLIIAESDLAMGCASLNCGLIPSTGIGFISSPKNPDQF